VNWYFHAVTHSTMQIYHIRAEIRLHIFIEEHAQLKKYREGQQTSHLFLCYPEDLTCNVMHFQQQTVSGGKCKIPMYFSSIWNLHPVISKQARRPGLCYIILCLHRILTSKTGRMSASQGFSGLSYFILFSLILIVLIIMPVNAFSMIHDYFQ